MRLTISAAAIAVGVSLVLYFAVGAGGHSDVSMRHVDAPEPPPSSSAASSSGALNGAQAPKRLAVQLAHELAKADDLRVFAEAAKQKPELGGFAYAQVAANMCQLRESPALQSAGKLAPLSNHPSVHKRIEAYKRFERRCGSFTKEELANDYGVAFMREGRQRGDVIVNAQYALGDRFESTKRSRDGDSALVAEAMMIGDPLILDMLQTFTAVVTKDGKPRSYLDGVEFGGVPRQDFHYAWMLTGCAFSNCDLDNNTDVLLACVNNGVCVADRVALLEWELSRQPGRFDRIMQVQRRLVSVIQNREVEALLPPPAVYAQQMPIGAMARQSTPGIDATLPGRGLSKGAN